MWFTALTVAVGVVLGLALGGRPRYLPEHAFHLWPLLLVGLALQVVVELRWAEGVAFPLLLVSYACLIGFGLLNLRLTGMGVIVVGMTMNLIPIALNRGMPVRPSAVVAAGLADNEVIATGVQLTGLRHVVFPGQEARAEFLGDIIPVRPIRQVVSFGDLVISVGTISLMAHLLRPPRRRED